jgi:hypothetical protein
MVGGESGRPPDVTTSGATPEGQMKEQRCPLTVGHHHDQGAHAIRQEVTPLG